jgi:arylsulfatase A-like enzyme
MAASNLNPPGIDDATVDQPPAWRPTAAQRTSNGSIVHLERLLVWLGACAVSLTLAASAQAADRSPNVLLILTDNTGWGDFGAYGGGLLRGAPSPNIDKLASDGMKLLNFNTEPQCTPSRSALMTGRFAIRSGTQSVPLGTAPYGLLPWEVTIAEALKAKGYATAIFGKWHLGDTAGRFPTDHGFDEWYGIPNSSGESLYLAPDLMARMSVSADARVPRAREPWIMEAVARGPARNVKPYDLDARRRIDGEITRRTIDFMDREVKAGKPFFAFVPMTAMHFPTLPHPDFAGKSGHGDYADMLVQTDAYVGQMVGALDKLGVTNDTIVIFTADNGVEHPDNGDGQYSGWTGPWAGTYFTAMEGGLRVPFIVRWPGKVPAGAVNNEIVHLVDIFPTLAGLTGAQVPNDRPIDGVDMTAFFTGGRANSGREGFVVYVADDLRAAKWHDWKVHFAWAETKYSPIERYSTAPKVIDLTRDPRETRQVAEPYNAWLQFPVLNMIGLLQASMKKFPNIPVGAPDDFVPAYAAPAAKP